MKNRFVFRNDLKGSSYDWASESVDFQRRFLFTFLPNCPSIFLSFTVSIMLARWVKSIFIGLRIRRYKQEDMQRVEHP